MKAKKSSRFAKEFGIKDWTLLVETLLMWEMWLKSNTISKKHVRRSQRKHRYIMYLIRKVGDRKKGMGLKIMKYHGIMHMTQDMFHFGVPMDYDTGADESGHKPSKTAAKLTQKRKDTFDEQVAKRLSEVHVLALAMEETRNERTLWDYYKETISVQPRNSSELPEEQTLNGGRYECNFEGGLSQWSQVSGGILGGHDDDVDGPFIRFVGELSLKVVEHGIINLQVRTVHERNGILYRGDVQYDGGVWRDWEMVDWGPEGVLPNKI